MRERAFAVVGLKGQTAQNVGNQNSCSFCSVLVMPFIWARFFLVWWPILGLFLNWWRILGLLEKEVELLDVFQEAARRDGQCFRHIKKKFRSVFKMIKSTFIENIFLSSKNT